MLFLASSSPRRLQILNDHNIPFKQIQNRLINEPDRNQFESPMNYVVRVAYEKVIASKVDYSGFILGVDTIVVFNNQVFGKPKSLNQAKIMLSEFAGVTHQVISACAIVNTDRNQWSFCIDYGCVSFKKKCDESIKKYIESYQPLDKAGGYGIQDNPDFIKKIYGDYYSIMGLPVNRLLKICSYYGIVK